MGLFDMFKKKDKVVKGNDNMEHIWNLTDTNDFVVAMTEHLDNKTQYGEDMSALSEAERIFYITQTLEMEVNNGGFSQFFYNSSGNFSNELVGAFTAIGANATAAICQKAISWLKRGVKKYHLPEFHFLDAMAGMKLKHEPEEERKLFQQCKMAYYVSMSFDEKNVAEKIKKQCKENYGWHITG